MPDRATRRNYAGVQLEREALRRLPTILEDLLDEPHIGPLQPQAPDSGLDAIVDGHDRRWLIEVKSAASPGAVASAAEQIATLATRDGIAVLVVPFMTPAGAKAAAARDLNWLDLSGNAHIRDEALYVSVQGRPNQFAARGRPSSAFAPKSSRVTRALLLDPERWWRQKELREHSDLDASRVSRVVRRLEDDDLLARDGAMVRPRDRDLLLDAWADEYRFDRHDIITGHLSGSGVELARELDHRLRHAGVDHAFTGLPAAWALDRFARFRLNSVFVHGDPRAAADAIELRRNERGANVQLVGPNDRGVFDGQRSIDDLPCVSLVQVYLDLLALPERASEAAEELRHGGAIWHASP
ncbi:MAG: type IV toxin-antitoxin system AbiEi family antitoxin [Solirubrobacteraceae bacterium]